MQKYRRKHESGAIRAIPVPQQGRSARTSTKSQLLLHSLLPQMHRCLTLLSIAACSLNPNILSQAATESARDDTDPRLATTQGARLHSTLRNSAAVRARHERGSPQHVSDHCFRDGLAARQQQQQMLRGARAGSCRLGHWQISL